MRTQTTRVLVHQNGSRRRSLQVLIKCVHYLLLFLFLTKIHPQLHAIVVDILWSEVKRKKIQRLIHKHCAPKHQHLVPICSMKIRWNMMHAKVLWGLDLKLVCHIYILFINIVNCSVRPSTNGSIQWTNLFWENLRLLQNVAKRNGGWVLMNGKHWQSCVPFSRWVAKYLVIDCCSS